MFYQTTIKSVGNTGVVDAQGRYLRFIGDLPVKEGDTVFTDGKYIFGHAPPKGSPAIFDEPSGIPVLGDEYSLSTEEQKEELRGYFTPSGKYKRYRVKGDEWITNDKKKFAHDGEDTARIEIDGQKVIDAGVTDDGDIYIATDGLYRENKAVKYNNHIFIESHSGEAFQADGAHWVNAYVKTSRIGEEITLGVEAETVDISTVIYKNSKKIDEFNLKTFADMAVRKSITARDEIMSFAANADENGNPLSEPPEGVNWLKQPPPPESFIAASSARVLTFKFDQHGEWDAIITASAYGYCFPFLYLHGSVLEASFDSEEPSFDNYLPDCISALEEYIFDDGYYPFLEIEKYPRFSGTKKSGGQYTAEYQKWCEEAIAYYIPLVRFTFFEWYPVAFGASMLLHVHNGEIVTTMQSRCGKGNVVAPYGSWTESTRTDFFSTTFRLNTEVERNDWQFPIGDKIFIGGNGIQANGIFDGDGEKLSDPPDFYFGNIFEPYYPFNCTITNDKVAEDWYKEIGAPNISVIHRFEIYLPTAFYIITQQKNNEYTVDSDAGGYILKHFDEISGLEDLKPYHFLGEFFDMKVTDPQESYRDGLFRCNPSCAVLKGDKFLFGTYGEQLYLKDSGDWQQVGDGLKNFRLRELKKMTKAKK